MDLKSFRYDLRSAPDKFLERFFPERHYQRRKKRWDKRWSDESFQSWWTQVKVPSVLKEAVAEGWFPEGATVLDIGCGDGEIAFWLAEQGYDAMGFDYSYDAIEKAKKTFGEEPGKLAYETLDAIELPEPERQFDALFDRGCFHIIPETYADKFARGIAAWAKPGAHFLLLGAIHIGPRKTSADFTDRERKKWREYAIETLSPYFDVIRVEDSYIPLARSKKGRELPATAIWLVRK